MQKFMRVLAMSYCLRKQASKHLHIQAIFQALQSYFSMIVKKKKKNFTVTVK